MNNLNISTQETSCIQTAKPLLWLNKSYQQAASAPDKPDVDELYKAEARLQRFAPLLETVFPELASSKGIIESELLPAPSLNKLIHSTGGQLYLKADHALPVAGSIKARGGIYEVLCFAEQLALKHGLIKSIDDSPLAYASAQAKIIFARYNVVVGSTGNLGLSIGIMAAALGFNAIVHMSSDAKQWKKERLRKRGVEVIEHQGDYGAAVEAGRQDAEKNDFSYFIDDENSPRLFMGYAVAALRLKQQLQAANIGVDGEHPLFVYLPAGVGGAPGGISFGLKALFGDHVHCFFAEPAQAPCMLLGLAGKAHSTPTSVYDFDLIINTQADGLAVGTASQWVCDATRDLVSGVYTASDKQLFEMLYQLKATENIEVEPSATIGCFGPGMLNSDKGRAYLEAHALESCMQNSTHIAWLTGGSFVPQDEYQHYFYAAKSVMQSQF